MPRVIRHLVAVTALAFAAILLTTSVQAQTGIYVQFTGQTNDVKNSNGWFWGPTFGFYHDQHSVGPIHLGMDFRGSILKHDSAEIDSGLGGLRLTVVPHVIPFKVYGEALGGIGIVGTGSSSTHFQYQFNGGLEYTILPRIDWRVAEVAYNGYTGNSAGNPVGISTGLVFRLP